MLANWSLRRRLTVVLVAIVGVFATAAGVAIVTVVVRNNLVHERKAHLDPASDAVERFVAAAIDQETGERGYVISADEQFLEPYDTGRRAAAQATQDLRDDLRSDGSRAALATASTALATWQRDAAEPEIAAVRAGDRADAVAHVADGTGKDQFDAVRAAAAALQSSVKRDIATSTHRLDRMRNILNLVAIGGFILATLLIALLAALIDRWVRRPVARLAEDASRVARGRLDTPIRAEGPPDLRMLAEDVDAMRAKLLGDLAGALRTNLLEVQQAERQRLAADLHDDPIQVLTVAVMRLDLLRGEIGDDATGAKVDGVRTTVCDAIDSLRTMLFELAPPSLDRHGLARALDDYTTELFSGTGTVVQVDTTIDRVLSSGVRSVAFRVAREAIANARKHAEAASLHITIALEHGGVGVGVRDDGRGFTAANDGSGLHRGLEFGANLVRGAGGWWTIDSTPGEGTAVVFWLPDAALLAPAAADGARTSGGAASPAGATR